MGAARYFSLNVPNVVESYEAEANATEEYGQPAMSEVSLIEIDSPVTILPRFA